ncbi:hypothetical protein GP939_22750 [Escherichia coli]|nr:hypothetical protein [Escherichia coli]
MITEKENVFYCDCGFSFERGRSGAHSCETGLRKKLAESEAKLAALAAENAWLKNAITAVSKTSEECEINGDELKYVVEPSEFDALTDLLDETPATDAFLAEVRAQGVEMFAERKNNEMMSLHPDTHAVGSIAAEMSSQVKQLREFADELRKGVQS